MHSEWKAQQRSATPGNREWGRSLYAYLLLLPSTFVKNKIHITTSSPLIWNAECFHGGYSYKESQLCEYLGVQWIQYKLWPEGCPEVRPIQSMRVYFLNN